MEASLQGTEVSAKTQPLKKILALIVFMIGSAIVGAVATVVITHWEAPEEFEAYIWVDPAGTPLSIVDGDFPINRLPDGYEQRGSHVLRKSDGATLHRVKLRGQGETLEMAEITFDGGSGKQGSWNKWPSP